MTAFFVPMNPINQAKIRRLQVLKVQAAQRGYSTPPEVTNEIADLTNDVGIPMFQDYGSRDLATEMSALAGRLNQFSMLAMITSSSALLMAIADFILILALRGQK